MTSPVNGNHPKCENIAEKTCSLCKEALPESFFHRKDATRLASRCKACVKKDKAKLYISKLDNNRAKGVRQVEFDELNTEIHKYKDAGLSADLKEIEQVLKTFVIEEVYEIK